MIKINRNTTIKEKDLDDTFKFLRVFSKPMDILEEISKQAKTKNFTSTKFLNAFFNHSKKFDVQDYRNSIIQQIRKKYTIQEFYKYENILNKLFWNLKRKLKPYVKNNKTKYKIVKNIDEYVENSIHVHSTKNQDNQFNEKNNKWYVLEKLSKLDKICMNIMRYDEDRTSYEYWYYFNNPKEIKKYKNLIVEPYYYMNYPFPNVNPMFYNQNKKSFWTKKIKKMYYTNSKDEYHKYDKYWYRLIRP